MSFYPTIVTVATDPKTWHGSEDLVSLRALWTMRSGEQYEVTVPSLSLSGCASLVLLLCAGEISPLALLALQSSGW